MLALAALGKIVVYYIFGHTATASTTIMIIATSNQFAIIAEAVLVLIVASNGRTWYKEHVIWCNMAKMENIDGHRS